MRLWRALLAAGHKHDEGYQNEQDRKRPEDD